MFSRIYIDKLEKDIRNKQDEGLYILRLFHFPPLMLLLCYVVFFTYGNNSVITNHGKVFTGFVLLILMVSII